MLKIIVAQGRLNEYYARALIERSGWDYKAIALHFDVRMFLWFIVFMVI